MKIKLTETSFELGKEPREFGTFGGPQVDLEEVMAELLKGPETDDFITGLIHALKYLMI